MQTTAIDQTAGLVNLTTVLAHASGEWIASDWPVCALSDTATPHRMGSALTYARRYALFTLVGIAGEDDLDAPDLSTPGQQTEEPERPKGNSDGRPNGGRYRIPQRGADRGQGMERSRSAQPMLGSEASAELRERLVAELRDLAGGDDAAIWAHRRLPEKNKLMAADAQRVEQAFALLLASFAAIPSTEPQTSLKAEEPLIPHSPLQSAEPRKRSRAERVEKSTLALPEPRRVRDRDHVRYVAMQPCLICGRHPCDAHHLRFAQTRALGRKVSDEFTVPLCRGHHREVHKYGDEAKWWRTCGVNALAAARKLWLDTHRLSPVTELFGRPKHL